VRGIGHLGSRLLGQHPTDDAIEQRSVDDVTVQDKPHGSVGSAQCYVPGKAKGEWGGEAHRRRANSNPFPKPCKVLSE
jgi:hypothetical protein